ncbi:hypothetical protein RRSWK_04440 [Rhodopirellula sp. SWK7]|nr:hypothetical protein RRSWK_04440 [Rhodopirellula sp. SWK7]
MFRHVNRCVAANGSLMRRWKRRRSNRRLGSRLVGFDRIDHPENVL